MGSDSIDKALRAPFEPDDIEWRISSVKPSGMAQILAYVTARGVMNRLDDVFGWAGWSDSYRVFQRPDGKCGIVCTIDVIDPDGVRVSKSDGASETDFEPFKGGLSDAFKRAANKYGIGRYLYNLPQTWVQISDEWKNHPDARYVNDRQSGIKGLWVPPRLPAWAVPDNYEYQTPPPPQGAILTDENGKLTFGKPSAAGSSGGKPWSPKSGGGGSFSYDECAVKYNVPYKAMTDDVKAALKGGGARFRGKKNNPQDAGADNCWWSMKEIESDLLKPFCVLLKSNVVSTNEGQTSFADGDDLDF